MGDVLLLIALLAVVFLVIELAPKDWVLDPSCCADQCSEW